MKKFISMQLRKIITTKINSIPIILVLFLLIGCVYVTTTSYYNPELSNGWEFLDKKNKDIYYVSENYIFQIMPIPIGNSSFCATGPILPVIPQECTQQEYDPEFGLLGITIRIHSTFQESNSFFERPSPIVKVGDKIYSKVPKGTRVYYNEPGGTWTEVPENEPRWFASKPYNLLNKTIYNYTQFFLLFNVREKSMKGFTLSFPDSILGASLPSINFAYENEKEAGIVLTPGH